MFLNVGYVGYLKVILCCTELTAHFISIARSCRGTVMHVLECWLHYKMQKLKNNEPTSVPCCNSNL